MKPPQFVLHLGLFLFAGEDFVQGNFFSRKKLHL